jgi:hypothetical protein
VRDRFATLAVAVVIVHLAFNVAHGWAHLVLPVPTSPAQNAFIIPVIGIAPLGAAALVLRGRARAGAWLLAVSMLGSLAFGVIYHYVVDSPDHVAHVRDGAAGAVFRASSLGLALTELAGVLVGGRGVIRAGLLRVRAARVRREAPRREVAP